MALAFAAAGSPEDQKLIDTVLAERQETSFAEAWLRAKGLGWAADLLSAFAPREPSAAVPVTPSEIRACAPGGDRAMPPPLPSSFSEVIATPNAEEDDLLGKLRPFRAPAKPNRAARRRAARGLLTGLTAAFLLSVATPDAARALTVFDPANYQENLLAATRALEQINNQVRQLQNQAQMLMRLDQNLIPIGGTISADLQRTLGQIQSQLLAGDGLALQLRQTEARYQYLFPKEVAAALSRDDVLRNAKSRWDEEYEGLKRAAQLQGQIADTIETDTQLLGDAMQRSRNATGALEAVQAGNELTGLTAKQSLTLQSLLAAQHRAETLNRARDLATEDEARERLKTFLGTGSGYTTGQ